MQHDRNAVSEFAHRSLTSEPSSIGSLALSAAHVLGAESGSVLIADYALRSVRELRPDGGLGDPVEIEGTMAGRAFAAGEVVHGGDGPVTVWFPLAEGADRIGVLQLTFADFPSELLESDEAAEVVRMLVLLLVSGRRYTDVVLRARRARPLSEAAEAQWDLLPPLSYESESVSVSGVLEPAYEIGGDSFDYAFNPRVLEFAMLDAAGHGLAAVLMASAAIHALRNARRERRSLEETYHQVDRRIAEQFGNSFYVTGQIASLDLATGELSWLNAGHVLPMLVRNGSLIGELECRPSKPMGLGGDVVQVSVDHLQRGDRVLFLTDGVTESRSPDGSLFGHDRLADFLVRATLDGLPVAETVRRLSSSVVTHVGEGLRDDATMFLVEYRGDER